MALTWTLILLAPQIEAGLSSSQPDRAAIVRALVTRVGAVGAISTWRWFS